MEFIASGVPNLDLVLGGGIVAGSLLMVTGAPGCGKTILAQQIAFHAARQGRQVLVLTTLSEPHTKLLSYLRTLAFYDEQLIGERIELLNIYRQLREDFGNVGATILRLAREHRAGLLIIDSFDSARDLAPREVDAKELIYELSASLGLLGVTVVVVSALQPEQAVRFPELAIADAIVMLTQELHGVRSVRSLEVIKMRGAAQRNGRHTYRIDDAGFAVYPRQETLPLPERASLGDGRVPFGLAPLDRMMAGGPPRGNNTILVGNPSTGKTLLALQFILEGHRRGERGLFIGFQETEQQLMAKAVALGIGAPEAFAGGVDFAHYVPAELDADEVAAVIRDRIAGEGGPGIARLVIDNIDNLLDGVLDASRRLGFVSALVAHLGAAGVTTCFTQDIAATGGREMQAQLDEFSIYCDNLLLLRQLEYRAQMHRVVSVVKMRNSDHDRTLREFTIGQGGLTILSPEQTAGGVLEALGRVGPVAAPHADAGPKGRG